MRFQQLALLLNRRQRRARQRSQHTRNRLTYFGMLLGGLVSISIVGGLLYFALAYARLTNNLPSIENLPMMLNPVDGLLMQPTRLYDRSGQHQLLALENPGVARGYLYVDPQKADHLAPIFIQAAVAFLQDNFWNSPGFAWDQAWAQKPVTIAERLVDSLLLDEEPHGLKRSLRMRLLAAQALNRYGQALVLEWYLNSVYFGHLAYGADSAAHLYLDKSASDLNLAESALLLGLIDTPSLNPLEAPAAAVERQQEVLDVLSSSSFFSQQQVGDARTEEIQFNQAAQALIVNEYSRQVLDQLSENIPTERIERGGLVITTTLDYDLQQQLACSARIQLQRLQGDASAGIAPSQQEGCEAALLLPTFFPGEAPMPANLLANALVMDPKSGDVLAMLGQVDIKGSARTTLQAQPGSLLSPFVALSAFARGISPANLAWDIPLEGDSALPYASLGDMSNPDGIYHGPMRLRTALANDYLVPIARLQVQIGSSNVWQQMQALGLPGLDQVQDPDRLLFSGGSVSLLSAAQAYSTFANLGVQYGRSSTLHNSPQPNLVLQVEDISGRVLVTHKAPVSQSLLSPQLAYLVQSVLGDEVARQRSLGYPNPLEIGRPAGVKIGQVENERQVWTLGYTPDRLAVVWLGLPDGEANAEGAQLKPVMAAGIWHAVMQYVERDAPVENWEMPSGLMRTDVCDPSGELPTDYCPLVVNEVFLIGSQPTTSDSLYQSYLINEETGKLATIFTPLEKVVEKIYLVPPPEAQQWAQESGLPTPPSDYDAIQAPEPPPGVQISSPMQFAYVRGRVVIKGSAAGNDFASYRLQVSPGLNPRAWIQIGEESSLPVEEGVLGVWDTDGLDGLYALRLTVVRVDHRLETHVVQVSVDNSPPQIEIPYPSPEQQFNYVPGGAIHFRADLSDNIGVAAVEWYLDGKKMGENTIAPFTVPWEMIVGMHELQVKARDPAGNEAESETVTFWVNE